MLYTQIALARNINEKITSATYCAILHHGQLDAKKGRDNKLSDRHTRKDRRSRNDKALKNTYMCGQIILDKVPGGGYSPKNWIGVCGPLPKTLTLFMTKICDFPYPIYDLTKNLIPYLWPDSVWSTSIQKPLEPSAWPFAWPERVTSRCGTYTVTVNIMMKK